ncbi:MAG: hypothetical protein ACO1N0_00600 [Fluviicola sp.]
MRLITCFLILFPLIAFSQTKSKFQPDNCIQIDSNTFFGQTEITNRMYREFTDYVKDSLFTHLLYENLPYERAKLLLNTSKKTLKKLTEDKRSEYLLIYGLDYAKYQSGFTWDSLGAKIVQSLFYPQPERFYRRRELDTRKLIYKLPSGEQIPVYPDTAAWDNDYHALFSSDSFLLKKFDWGYEHVYYYNWFPVYDNYAVVGLNLKQMQAYCDWYERQLNTNSEDKSLHYSVSIPTIEEYTTAMKQCTSEPLTDKIDPKNLKDPLIFLRNSKDAFPHIHPAYKDYSTWRGSDSLSLFKAKQWAETNATQPILNLLGSPAEVVKSPVESNELTVLGGDYHLEIVDPKGIQANTLFYQRRLSKDKGYSYVGFRIIVTTKHN